MKAELTVIIKYDLIPEYYPDNCSIEEMVAIDQENFNSDPDALLELVADSLYDAAKIKVDLALVKED